MNSVSLMESRNFLIKQMNLSKNIVVAQNTLLRFISDSRFSTIRYRTIVYINEVFNTYALRSETRDCSIHIYDLFMAELLIDSGIDNIVNNKELCTEIAIVCISISVKLYESKPLQLTSFTKDKCLDLINLEQIILSKIAMKINSNCTSTSVIEHLLILLPKNNIKNSQEAIEKAKIMAFKIITKFLETSNSIRYSPITVAISSLLVSFSKMEIDLTCWLELIPDVCLPHANHPLFQPELLPYIDCDACIQEMERSNLLRNTFIKDNSSNNCKFNDYCDEIDKTSRFNNSSPTGVNDFISISDNKNSNSNSNRDNSNSNSNDFTDGKVSPFLPI